VLPLGYGVSEAGRGKGLCKLLETGQKSGTENKIFSMPQQPEVTSTSLAATPASALGAASEALPDSVSDTMPIPAPELETAQTMATTHPPQRIPRWLVSCELFLRVLLRIYLGLVILLAPWSGELVAHSPQVLFLFPWLRSLWAQNQLFVWFPTLGIYAANGAVRGMVSGLGLLNLWIAFHDAIHYRDR